MQIEKLPLFKLDRTSTINILSFSLTFTSAISLLYIYSWPAAFLCPLLCLHIRYYDLTSLPFYIYVKILFVSLGGIISGLAISQLYQVSPILFVFSFLCLLLVLSHKDRFHSNDFYTSLRLICATLVCTTTLVQPNSSIDFSVALALNLSIAMAMSLTVDKFLRNTQPSKEHHVTEKSFTFNPWRTPMMLSPVVFLFLLIEIPDYYTIVIVICILSFATNPQAIKHQSFKYLKANLLGGLLAIFGFCMYEFISIVIGESSLLGLVIAFMTSSVLGYFIYGPEPSNISAFTLSPFALLIVQSDNSNFNLVDSYLLRISCIVIAILYILIVINIELSLSSERD